MKTQSELTPLKKLLKPWLSADIDNVMVSCLTLDSRNVVKDSLFVALQGACLDGRSFIDKAITQGASAVLSETSNPSQHGIITYLAGVPVIDIYQLPAILSPLAYRFYFPQQNVHNVVAVTGTNGKTTIASLLVNCFTLLGKKSAQMGTIGNGLFGELKSSLNTTLDALSVFAELYDYQQKQVEYTVMEVSSHGLSQGRVSALPFHSAIFTNLSRDHLDYHGSMANYGAAKKALFTEHAVKYRIINSDDATGKAWLKEFPDAVAYGFNVQSVSKGQSYLSISKVNYQAQGVDFKFESSWGAGHISAPFYGDFNVSNLAAVLTQLLLENITIAQLEAIFPKLTSVPGRMEQYYFAKKDITFVVDYAHTPDALEKALIALQKHKSSGRLICVFGCGGDRDKGKRSEMAKVAENFAQKVVLVDDNPRSESAEDIMEDILRGFNQARAVMKIHDRKEAVLFLLTNSLPGDIVLLAGKGHEDYQIIGDKRLHYSDRALLASLRKEQYKDLNKADL
ncbi:UDP-N-acetylmuramoyl-L-alanyl-D-glutamate--2,6-diaminopimelate ligase [Psychromonas antarctica]|uniref:UDP-N-acetylmuramoyl-L-alanyl-D-glutamate--2, 6-diaminopimelate ligase n=1 Tax=Psychromonas antarctica TaxID=67573 RepID=UPI001EE788D1|nr:UDP-N-acetylmuramoyl-L-alanyl-D-glutamate--2,6-diaminopimelate ligase [Psychromonas antarctica]MCG6200357.1 UDP-N-acetylmuramoyl-L-alanyl-D-glutamate--2,6-diaminopimelate ligase [Psychromonas antarctica]